MEYKIEKNKNAAKVEVSGGITEKAQTKLKALAKDLSGGVRNVEFDCAGVNSINSSGVAHWVGMLDELDKGLSYEFARCSVFFLDYANMIPEITNGAPITSFFVPMKCDGCGKGSEILLRTQDVNPRRGFGKHSCKHCQGALTSEVEAEDYLGFLEEG